MFEYQTKWKALVMDNMQAGLQQRNHEAHFEHSSRETKHYKRQKLIVGGKHVVVQRSCRPIFL